MFNDRKRVARRTRWYRAVGAATFVLWLGSPIGVLAAPCWEPPVEGPIVDPFRMPTCAWCPGNRGLEFATSRGQQVTAVAAGTVTFAGTVAGQRYVVVQLGNGWRVTYGLLDISGLTAGDVVVNGQRIGTTGDRFHFGLRDGETYLDPEPYLGEWRFRPRLLPADGSPGRPPPPAQFSCRNPSDGG